MSRRCAKDLHLARRQIKYQHALEVGARRTSHAGHQAAEFECPETGAAAIPHLGAGRPQRQGRLHSLLLETRERIDVTPVVGNEGTLVAPQRQCRVADRPWIDGVLQRGFEKRQLGRPLGWRAVQLALQNNSYANARAQRPMWMNRRAYRTSTSRSSLVDPSLEALDGTHLPRRQGTSERRTQVGTFTATHLYA